MEDLQVTGPDPIFERDRVGRVNDDVVESDGHAGSMRGRPECTAVGPAIFCAYGVRQVRTEPATGAETFARAIDGHLRPAATSTPVTPRRVGVGPRR
jgi:hypothetical protein